jgi:hypothetical protein
MRAVVLIAHLGGDQPGRLAGGRPYHRPLFRREFFKSDDRDHRGISKLYLS